MNIYTLKKSNCQSDLKFKWLNCVIFQYICEIENYRIVAGVPRNRLKVFVLSLRFVYGKVTEISRDFASVRTSERLCARIVYLCYWYLVCVAGLAIRQCAWLSITLRIRIILQRQLRFRLSSFYCIDLIIKSFHLSRKIFNRVHATH